MKFLKGFISVILGIILFFLLFYTSLVYKTKTFIENNLLSVVVKESIINEAINDELEDSKRELLEKMYSDEKTDILLNRITKNYILYKEDKNYKLSEEDYNLLKDYFAKHKNEINEVFDANIKDEDIDNSFKYEDAKKFVYEAFEEFEDNSGEGFSDVMYAYTNITSTNSLITNIVSIVFILLLLVLVNWDFIKWMKVLGIDLIIVGVLICLLFIGLTAIQTKIIVPDEVITLINRINLTSFIVFGAIEVLVGILFIIIYNILKKRIDNKNENGKSIKKWPFMIIICVLSLASVYYLINNVGGSTIISNVSNNFSTPKEFDIYYSYLKKYEDKSMYKDDTYSFYAYKINDIDNAVISVVHNDDKGYVTTIYYIIDDMVKEKEYESSSEIIPLYNVDKDEYGYYLKEEKNGVTKFTLLDDIVMEKDEPYQASFKDSSYENHFISYSYSSSYVYLKDDNSNNLSNSLKTIIRESFTADDTLNSNEKEKVNEKKLELTKTTTNVKKDEVETIIVGNHTLKFGTYEGKMQDMSGNYTTVKVTITKSKINVDNEDRSYSISGNFIIVSGFEMFQVDNNDEIIYLAGECPTLKYKG